MGSADRIIRILIAIVAAYFAYSGAVATPWNYVLYAVAAIMLLTSFISSCPLYLPFGISTAKK